MPGAQATRDPVQICLGAAYVLAVHQHKREAAVSALKAAMIDDPELRTKLQAKRDGYSAVVADKFRNCHIERTMHELLTSAIAL